MASFADIKYVSTGYWDVASVDLALGDFEHDTGSFHVYASGAGSIKYRMIDDDDATIRTAVIPAGGGIIRFGDSLPIMVSEIFATDTTATGILVGILLRS